MNNVFTKSTVLLALLAILLGGGITSCKDDGDSGEAQPGYVGKIYSAKDGKSYLKIDTKDTATYCVWEEGSGAQASARAAETDSTVSGRYVEHQGKYTVSLEFEKYVFSLKIEWIGSDGKTYTRLIVADIENGKALTKFTIDGKTVEYEEVSTAPEKPSEDKSDGSDTGQEDITTPYGFVRVSAVSIKGTEPWAPESKVFVSGRAIEIPAFYICDHEVTRAEYKAIIGRDPSSADAYDRNGNKLAGDAVGNNPVNGVNWYDAIVYCNKLSIRENLTPCYKIKDSSIPADWGDAPSEFGGIWDNVTCDFSADGYRLPTEAEWEWAARGGASYAYAGSNDINEVAWYVDNTNDTPGTREVKAKKANGYGLYDMSGNVFEWCWDWYAGKISVNTEPTGSEKNSTIYSRIDRGGAYDMSTSHCNISTRGRNNLAARANAFGFRVVRTAK